MMKPEDMGIYVHTDDYDEVVGLLERIERLCSEKAALVAVHSIEDEITKFKKELEQNGISQR